MSTTTSKFEDCVKKALDKAEESPPKYEDDENAIGEVEESPPNYEDDKNAIGEAEKSPPNYEDDKNAIGEAGKSPPNYEDDKNAIGEAEKLPPDYEDDENAIDEAKSSPSNHKHVKNTIEKAAKTAPKKVPKDAVAVIMGGMNTLYCLFGEVFEHEVKSAFERGDWKALTKACEAGASLYAKALDANADEIVQAGVDGYHRCQILFCAYTKNENEKDKDKKKNKKEQVKEWVARVRCYMVLHQLIYLVGVDVYDSDEEEEVEYRMRYY